MGGNFYQKRNNKMQKLKTYRVQIFFVAREKMPNNLIQLSFHLIYLMLLQCAQKYHDPKICQTFEKLLKSEFEFGIN
jgi:hypothetical protein